MIELVGACTLCKKNVYCRDGFLDGVVGKDAQLYCMECASGKLPQKQGNEDRKKPTNTSL